MLMEITAGAKPERLYRWLALVPALAAFLVYFYTLAPDLTFEHYGADGGDLITAAWTLGVPHPPGYPTYTLLARTFTFLPVGSIAFRINLMSAVFAALAVYFFARIAFRTLTQDDSYLIIPLAAAFMLAFSPLLWSQAVIAEVYTLLSFFAALFLWLILIWRDGTRDWALWVAAFLFGLGLGNHLSLLFALPAVAAFFGRTRSICIPPLCSAWGSGD
jgi:4-amino-4-deoxy-L-arabinose transferase-like glycosyltransferase